MELLRKTHNYRTKTSSVLILPMHVMGLETQLLARIYLLQPACGESGTVRMFGLLKKTVSMNEFRITFLF